MKKLSTFLSLLLFSPAVFATNAFNAFSASGADPFNDLAPQLLGLIQSPAMQAICWLMLIIGLINAVRLQSPYPFLAGLMGMFFVKAMPTVLTDMLGITLPAPAPDNNPLQLLTPLGTAFQHLAHSQTTAPDVHYLLGVGVGLIIALIAIVFSALGRRTQAPTTPRRVIDLGKH